MLTITPDEFVKRLKGQSAAINKAIEELPRIIGVEAVNHFKDNFQKEGFDVPKSWQEVKRRTWGRGADASRKILTGRTGDLGRSIQKRVEQTRAIIFSDLIYAPVHNYGLRAGRGKGFLMPKRQFIGDSKILEDKLMKIIKKRIDSILK